MAARDEGTRLKVDVTRSLVAYRIPGWSRYQEIVPAAADRQWMDFGTNGWANRCLPLRIANQSGWWILNDVAIEAEWNGKPQLDGVRIRALGDGKVPFVDSMFGFGVLTWSIPYLFQTPAGYSLYVRGPSNLWKDGIVALDAIPETDWLPYPFTMNWRFTRPFKKVKFEAGEPVCMIVPVRRAEVEEYQPQIRNLESAPELLKGYQTWHAHRTASKQEREAGIPRQLASEKGGHYIRGQGYDGEKAHGHQVKLDLKPFVPQEDPPIRAPVSNESPRSELHREGWFRRLFPR